MEPARDARNELLRRKPASASPPPRRSVGLHSEKRKLNAAHIHKQLILGIGTDLAEVGRIRDSVARFGPRFLHRIYTEAEQRYALSKANSAERLAARFAAKEAGMKAIGTGWSRGVRWLDFEVTREPGGKPGLRLSGVAAQVAQHMGVKNIALSLTHTAENALAVVILEDGK